jgi:hypothetical protein
MAGGGGGGGGGLTAATTTAVCDEVAAAEPLRFVAVTITRSVWLTSAVERTLVVPVAPLIALQLAPAVSQRSHWYAYRRRLPCQVPVVAVSVFGTCAVPLTEGGVMFFGGCCRDEEEPPDAPPVARINVSAAAVTALVMRRLITSLPSGGGERFVTLKGGTWGPGFAVFSA